VENLRTVVIGLLLSCIASSAFGQDGATPHPFYMLGEITHPGEFPYQDGLNVVSAIAMAGGETARASKAQC
jgi:SLBB domain